MPIGDGWTSKSHFKSQWHTTPPKSPNTTVKPGGSRNHQQAASPAISDFSHIFSNGHPISLSQDELTDHHQQPVAEKLRLSPGTVAQ